MVSKTGTVYSVTDILLVSVVLTLQLVVSNTGTVYSVTVILLVSAVLTLQCKVSIVQGDLTLWTPF